MLTDVSKNFATLAQDCGQQHQSISLSFSHSSACQVVTSSLKIQASWINKAQCCHLDSYQLADLQEILPKLTEMTNAEIYRCVGANNYGN